MTADWLDTITKLIQSPPGQLAAGGVLAGIVWKFFERVESVLNENTKLEIAVWLLGVKVGQKLEPWPDTFARVFDRVFGAKHLSWKCFWRSAVATLMVAGSVALLLDLDQYRSGDPAGYIALGMTVDILPLLVAFIPADYLSLFATRQCLRWVQRMDFRGASWLLLIAPMISSGICTVLGLCFVFWTGIAAVIELALKAVSQGMGVNLFEQNPLVIGNGNPYFRGFVIVFAGSLGCLISALWLWLYAGSGFILKAARRFDIGFDWFNRHFDIEKKPLQSIGLVAGALVAVLYWAVVIASRVMG